MKKWGEIECPWTGMRDGLKMGRTRREIKGVS
jgi:hypothetical protein